MFLHIAPETLSPALPCPHPALWQLAKLYSMVLVWGGCLGMGAVRLQLHKQISKDKVAEK